MIKSIPFESVEEITLLTVEQAKRLPKKILACGRWWWIRLPGAIQQKQPPKGLLKWWRRRAHGYSQNCTAYVTYDGFIHCNNLYINNNINVGVRPAFVVPNLSSKIGAKIQVGNHICTVIEKNLVLADSIICRHRFDSHPNNWEASELKIFIESDEFKKVLTQEKKVIRHISVESVKEITLLTTEQAERLPKEMLDCGEWWWIRSPGDNQYNAAGVNSYGSIYYNGSYVRCEGGCVRPVFIISNLGSKIGAKVRVGNCVCTVIDKDLAFADDVVCDYRFDGKSNNWDKSELKAFIEGDGFKSLIMRGSKVV